MMPVYKVVTTGSALAAALQTVATAKEGFGFMIGSRFPLATATFEIDLV